MDAPDSLVAPCFNSQKANENHLRICQLITMLCGDLFRDILSRHIRPTNLRSELDRNRPKLEKILNKQQKNLMYPVTGNTLLTGKDFDISIIYILLRNICNIPSHKAGWGNPPAKGDNSIAAGIEMIQLKRNLISAHSPNGMIEDLEFEKHWNDLRDVVQIETQLTGSDLYKRGVDFLHSCNLTSVGTEADHNEEKNGDDTIYDRRSARFAEFFDEIAEGVPVEKIARLKDFIQNSCKAEDITSLKQAVSARECLRYLRDAKLFTSSDVIFVQYLFKRINCNELFVECYRYAEKQDALCFYEKPPANGYQNVLFHVQGNLSDYSFERIAEIRETLAVLLNCTSKEILIGGACPSNSFLLVVSIKETYSGKLLALEQCDKDKLTKLNIDYIIVDLIVINLEPSKESGWNFYFNPKYFNRGDENMPFQEKKSTVSPLQHSLSGKQDYAEDEGSDRENPLNIDQIKISENFKAKGWPEVILKQVPPAYLDESVEFKAIMRSFPSHDIVLWKKDNQEIDINNPKYEMSVNKNDDSATLCIKNIKNEDEGIYTVEVRSELGDSQSSQTLIVIKATQRIFISGPVVVSPSEEIIFEAYLPGLQLLNPKWWKKKDGSTKEIEINSEKYSVTIDHDNKYKFIILNAEEEDSAEYQISSTDMKSNAIYVHVDDSEKFSKQGNCLRFFALQAVSADAMRKVCNSKFDKFEETIHKIICYCESNQHIRRKKELLLRLKTKETKSLEDVDISLMYAILREEKTFTIPKNGWGKRPKESDIDEADDIERIRYYRNLICHLDASNMETSTFNESVLDLLGAIRRLSKDNANLIKRSCDILNEVFTDSEGIQMMDELEIFRQEQEEWDHLLHNEDFLAAVQNIQRNIQYTDVIFHDVCDEGIQISENGTRATQDILYRGYVCFMNRPLKPGDEVHLRGEHIEDNLKYYKERAHIKIGLTNSAPSRNSINSGILFREVNCVQEKCPGKCVERFHLRIKLHDSVGCALMTSLNDTVRNTYIYPALAAIGPFWLAINPYGIKSIKISNI